MEFAYKFIEVLSKSIEKNGNKELTTQHLLNIVKLCVKSIETNEERHQQMLDEAMMEIYASQCGDRD
jgi:hypothetical protein